jgi:hypothetical protein
MGICTKYIKVPMLIINKENRKNQKKEKNTMWRGRHRCGRRGRYPKPITLAAVPPINNSFTPNIAKTWHLFSLK